MEIISVFRSNESFGGPVKSLELFKSWLNSFDISETLNSNLVDFKKIFPGIDENKLSIDKKDKLVSERLKLIARTIFYTLFLYFRLRFMRNIRPLVPNGVFRMHFLIQLFIKNICHQKQIDC